ncbi:MAG: LptF/LptG family permease [Ignavibacteria bacterium]|nr:LptF/LptG family permease [Ignavibacteria bacterium]
MILYRYLTRLFFQVLFFSIFALTIVFIIVSMIENLDDFIDNNATTDVIVKYYIYFVPEVIKIVTPISVLISILFSVGRLSTLNEIIAMKAGGLSLYKLLLPYAFLTFLISFALLYFNGWVVPVANEKKFVIEKKYWKKEPEVATIYNFFFRDSPRRNISFQYYDPDEFAGQYIFLEEFVSPTNPRIEKRIEGKRFVWDTTLKEWVMFDAVIRFFPNGQVSTEQHEKLKVELNITHEQLLKLQKRVEAMTFTELREYLNLLALGGKDVRRQMIKYYAGYAFPFSCLIIVLFAVPFASIKRPGGLALQIASAMTVSFLYLFFTEIGQIIIYATSFHPAVGGWFANLVFFIFGIFVLLKIRK